MRRVEEAGRALEAFDSVGVTQFSVLLLHDETGAVEEVAFVDGAELRRRLPRYLERNANDGWSFIVDVGDQVIQVDDCDDAVLASLLPFTFLTISTSPGSYQAWLCLSDPSARDAVRERLLLRLATTSANGAWCGGLRWPGSQNCKPRHRRPDGSFPTVRNHTIALGRRVTPAELERAGLLASSGWQLRPMFRRIVLACLYGAGFVRLAAWWNRKRVLIFWYSGITRKTDYPRPSYWRPLHLPEANLARQLDYLGRRYNVLSLVDYVAALREQRALPDYTVILAFTEGYRNFLTVALPLLTERGMPATVFLVPECVPDGKVEGNSLSWTLIDDRSRLSWAETTMLRQERGIEFGFLLRPGPHTPPFTPDQAVQHLRDGYAALVARIPQPTPPLAVRFGENAAAVTEEASRVGFSCAISLASSGENALVPSPFALRGIAARDYADDSLAAFAVHISGLKSWWWRLGRRSAISFPHDLVS